MVSPGLFLVMWGIFATVLGTIVATNFRGAAYRVNDMARPWPGARGRSPGVGFHRVIAGVFALVGPVTLVKGVGELMRGDAFVSGMPRLPLPFLAWMVIVAAVGLWTVWRPEGQLRLQWVGGGRLGRALAVASSLGWLGFAAGIVLGQEVLMVVSWAVFGAAGILTLVVNTPTGEPGEAPGDDAVTGKDPEQE
ncbi:hypothetical protein [Streptomyces sp. NPDC048623]|uniref:hypothetical protein n=1 Tax=Streptomyces sp. NPDC048623 TaxID=3155761 RepID=UPI0034369DF5